MEADGSMEYWRDRALTAESKLYPDAPSEGGIARRLLVDAEVEMVNRAVVIYRRYGHDKDTLENLRSLVELLARKAQM